MPCRSDYMAANAREIELSKVMSGLDELNGKGVSERDRDGYHPLVYNKRPTQEQLNVKTAELCVRMAAHKDLSTLSLEAQVWWRDHEQVDKDRSELERLHLDDEWKVRVADHAEKMYALLEMLDRSDDDKEVGCFKHDIKKLLRIIDERRYPFQRK